MKLYTEEQVRNMLDTFLLFTGNEDANDYIEYMTPIKLPSDEEIDKQAFQIPFDGTDMFYDKSFINGAK